MLYQDLRSGANSHRSIANGTINTANVTGTAVDLANKVGAMVLFTAASFAGTGSVTPYLHESNDASSWGTVAASQRFGAGHGVGIPGTVTGTASVLIGYHGNMRYIRAFAEVGGTPVAQIAATVISFASGILPVSGN